MKKKKGRRKNYMKEEKEIKIRNKNEKNDLGRRIM